MVFWGERSDIPEILGQMDISAFSTTEEEGFGIALIEALNGICLVSIVVDGAVPNRFGSRHRAPRRSNTHSGGQQSH